MRGGNKAKLSVYYAATWKKKGSQVLVFFWGGGGGGGGGTCNIAFVWGRRYWIIIVCCGRVS
jgi:hypothetical protein